MINPPKTIEEARAHRYGVWGGDPKGCAYEEGNCAESVRNDMGPGAHQCARKATKGLFCGQHSPEAKYLAAVEYAEAQERQGVDAL